MADQTTFGRRTAPSRPMTRALDAHDPVTRADNAAPDAQPVDPELLKHIASPPIGAEDDEFREWKKARQRHSGLPWRQLSLMASVSFGVASFVLPDSVGDTLDWILYGLMAASAYAGLSRRWS